MNGTRNSIRRVGFRFATLLLPIMIATIPALAKHSSSLHGIQQDPAGKECSRAGMPCSTASTPESSKSTSASTKQQLDQIERQSVNSFKAASQHTNSKPAAYRPPTVRGSSDRQSSINFSYRAPQPGGTRSTPNR
jgi:hypothetical protein